jgi:hypothetical protein
MAIAANAVAAPAGARILLKHGHLIAMFRQMDGGSHSADPGANYDNAIMLHSLFSY